MTSLVLVCTNRNTHPATTVDVTDQQPPKPPGHDPAPSLAEVMAEMKAHPPPRRGRDTSYVEYRCPACGQRRRLGSRRLNRFLNAQFALADAQLEGLDNVPLDISFI
jgi:hypothetical protein